MNNVICQCVVVLYRSTFEQSKTLRSLVAIKQSDPAVCAKVGLLVYDNSPNEQPQAFDGSGFGSFAYLHDPQNSGLAVAYNAGLSRAQTSGIDWLMLLDQDTELHQDSLHALFDAIECRPEDSICALLPKLMCGDTVLSPQRVGRFNNQSVAPDYAGISLERLTALNSAACLRVRWVEQIGGFPQEYWLEFLDHAVFYRLQTAGGKVQVLDTVIQHQLSSLNLEHEMSLSRYTGMLAAEWRFVRETGTGGGTLCHRLRLLKRTVTYAVRWKNKAYARETLRASLA